MFMHKVMSSLLSKLSGNVISTATTFIPFSLLFLLVPNYGSEVYGEGSICVEVNSTLGDCLPLGGTPRCYQRRIVQQPTTNEVAFAINVCGKQNMFTRSKIANTTTTFTSTTSTEHTIYVCVGIYLTVKTYTCILVV